ncbi:hypothetical protein B0E43_09730 [Algoriphagus sp. A40]|nr:hypothetical protein B0E43_09730 [Algoriphagus sp. A40]
MISLQKTGAEVLKAKILVFQYFFNFSILKFSNPNNRLRATDFRNSQIDHGIWSTIAGIFDKFRLFLRKPIKIY